MLNSLSRPPFFIHAITWICTFGALISGCSSSQYINSPLNTTTTTTVPLDSRQKNSTVNAITNPSFESWPIRDPACPEQWHCAQHSGPISYKFSLDDENFVHGKRSLSIERIGPEPWGIVSQYLNPEPLRGKSIRLTAQIKRERVDEAGGGLMLLAEGAGAGETAPLVTAYITGTQAWHRVEIVAKLPQATRSLQIGAALEGSGKMWIDDVTLEIINDK